MSAIAGQAVGAIAGGMMDIWAENRADHRQRSAEDRAKRRDREVMDHAQKLALEKFEKTGYEAQAEQLRDAGMNIGLMYGSAGQSGQSTSTASQSSQSVPNVQNNTGQYMAIGQQTALMNAQTKNIEADTKKKEVEANKLAGVDTNKTIAETNSLTQGIENQKALQALTEAETYLKEIAGIIAYNTTGEAVDLIKYNTERALHEVKSAKWAGNLSEATYNDKVKIVQQEAVNAVLKGGLMSSQAKLTDAQADKVANEIEVMWENLSLGHDKLLQEKDKVLIDAKLREAGLELQEAKLIMEGLQAVGNGIRPRGRKPQNKTTHTSTEKGKNYTESTTTTSYQ